MLLAEPISTAKCYCGKEDPGDGSFTEHVLTCASLRGATRVYRHNLVVAALHNSFGRFGIISKVEPRFYEYEDGTHKRPDITVFCPGVMVATDFVISNDCDEAVKKKTEKHAAAAQARGHEFMPTSMSIWGSFHPSVDKFLRRTFKHFNPGLRWLAILQTKRVMSEAWLAGSIAMLHNVEKQNTNKLLMSEDEQMEMEAAQVHVVGRLFTTS
jgi:hypothetical protein